MRTNEVVEYFKILFQRFDGKTGRNQDMMGNKAVVEYFKVLWQKATENMNKTETKNNQASFDAVKWNN